jgi:DNA polymerase III subunit delta'
LGKKQLADEFVNSILCHDYNTINKTPVEKVPCKSCVFCQQLKKGIHPDVFYLKKEEDKKNITVEQVRKIQKILHMASFLNSYKIAIIDNAQDLSESAQNALLKVLEEPKSKTILILITSDHHQLLPTIVSRCQLIKFYSLGEEEIFHHLVDLGASRDQAKIYTSLSHGQIGLAVNYFQDKNYYNQYLSQTEIFLNLFSSKLTQQFKVLDQLLSGFKTNLEKSDYLNKHLDSWALILRDVLLVKNNSTHLVINQSFNKNLQELADKYSTKQLIDFFEKITETKNNLNYNINPRLAVENLVLRFN